MAFGVDSSRYQENKRAVEDKYIGPLVKTIMTRCIHCTRCVRFTTEVAGISELGLVGRGEDAEITTFLEQAMTSELQGNVIDLCPVGALTSRPYAFQARPWELTKTETIDVMDAVGSAIRVDTRGREVMRILPRVNEEINEEWISDKTRFIWDGLRTQRLDKPYIRENGRLRPASWPEAFAAIKAKVDGAGGSKIGAIAGDLAAVEEMWALKKLIAELGSTNLDCRQDGVKIDPATAGRPTSSTRPSPVSRKPMLCSSSGPIRASRPRCSTPVSASAGAWRTSRSASSARMSTCAMDTPISGWTGHAVRPRRREPGLLRRLEECHQADVIVGSGALSAGNGADVLNSIAALTREIGAVTDGWNGFNVLHSAASRVGGLDIGFVPGRGGQTAAEMAAGGVDVLFNLGADEIEIADGPFVVYVGTHGDRGAHRADVILPGAAYTEKSGTWVNVEGRAQTGSRASFPPGDAREDWAILRALSAVLGKPLPFDSLGMLRADVYASHAFMRSDRIEAADASVITTLADRAGSLSGGAFVSNIGDFYLTNPIARASKVMAECSKLAVDQHLEAAE